MQEFIKINGEDMVAVALKSLPRGSTAVADQNTVALKEGIPQGHKLAVCRVPESVPVIRYGYHIGSASRRIRSEDWMYVRNVSAVLGDVLKYQYESWIEEFPKASPSSFIGYK